jgi:sec-independent protein translocase protein TatA
MGLSNPIHIAFLLVLLLIVFGAKRLPELGRSLGSGMRGFRDALAGEDSATHAETPQLFAAASLDGEAATAAVAHTAPLASASHAAPLAPVAVATEPIQADSRAA